MLETLLSFVIVFNTIVFVHEFGHYFMAKRAGIRIHEFALGMGPTIFKTERNKTIFALRALPIGGFVKMEGEGEDSDAEDSFSSKSPGSRFLVIIAGAMMNLFLAVVILLVINLSIGLPSLKLQEVVVDSPAYHAGMLAGDTIVSIDGATVESWEQVLTAISQADEEMEITVRRGDQLHSFSITPQESEGRLMIGIVRGTTRNPLLAIVYTFEQVGFLLMMMLGFFEISLQEKRSLKMLLARWAWYRLSARAHAAA